MASHLIGGEEIYSPDRQSGDELMGVNKNEVN